MNKKKNILLIVILLIFIFFIFKIKNTNLNIFQDELIFFEFFSSNSSIFNKTKKNNSYKSKTEELAKQIILNVSYKSTNFKSINISETLNPKTLVNEKIAPGTNGNFEILLKTNQEMNYKIKFKSENSKPKNLEFSIQGQSEQYQNLKDMEDKLEGRINKEKNIIINWRWKYNNGKLQDIEDTQDGTKIKEYKFLIYTIGY